MSRDQVANEFGWALAASGADDDGNLLADDLERRASMFVAADRASLVEVIREMLESRDELLTVQATILAGRLDLAELMSDIVAVRAEVAAGRFLQPSSAWVFDRVIARLDPSPT